MILPLAIMEFNKLYVLLPIITVLLTASLVLFDFENASPITGRVIAADNVGVSTDPSVVYINLTKGWNLLSIPCYYEFAHMFSVFRSIRGNYSSMHTYNALDKSDPWKSFSTALPSFLIQDLERFDHMNDYWINMKVNKTVTIEECEYLNPVNISLVKGWNLIGYPSSTTRPIEEVLSSINGKYGMVKTYNKTDLESPYIIFVPNVVNNLKVMEPTLGYWILMLEDAELVIT